VVEALRWYGSRLADGRLHRHHTGKSLCPGWPPVENALFRIAQEALTNVAKHAQASQVTIIVGSRQGQGPLIIADDGLGFEPGSSAKLFGQQAGVLTITERAEAVGGHCRIESQAGKGSGHRRVAR
jgi:signal transduction histidine kinase